LDFELRISDLTNPHSALAIPQFQCVFTVYFINPRDKKAFASSYRALKPAVSYDTNVLLQDHIRNQTSSHHPMSDWMLRSRSRAKDKQ